MNLLPTIQYGLKGICQVSVVERGQVVREYPKISNLILNRGLDDIASTPITNVFAWCAAGTGVTATEADGGSETATLSVGTVTISQTGFLAGDSTDVGRTIKLLSSGNSYQITAPISATQCSVLPADTVGPGNFIVYNTNQTGLTTESTLSGPSTKRTNTYLTGAPNCQSVTNGAVTLHTRTFDFSAETAPITYNEVGFSTTSVLGSNLFSRVKLSAGVPLLVGQQLRVQYSLSMTVAPITPFTYSVSPVVGWGSATGTMQQIAIPTSYVNSSGITQPGSNSVDGLIYGTAGEPSTASGILICIDTDSSAHASYGSRSVEIDTEAAVGSALGSYVSGTYTRDKFATFAVGQANAANWRSYSLAVAFGDGNHTRGIRFLFDSAQTKLSTFTLTLGFRITWGRIL